MNLKIIKNMIDDSIWKNSETKNVYKFFNGNSLSINGKKHLHYSIKSHKNRIELLIDDVKYYNIKYINDFILELSDKNERFKLKPE